MENKLNEKYFKLEVEKYSILNILGISSKKMNEINEFLNQIISLDQMVDRERERIDEEVDRIESEARDKIQAEEEVHLTAFKNKYKQKYDTELKKAQERRETTLAETKKECDSLFQEYEKIRTETARNVAKQLLLENINA